MTPHTLTCTLGHFTADITWDSQPGAKRTYVVTIRFDGEGEFAQPFSFSETLNGSDQVLDLLEVTAASNELVALRRGRLMARFSML